MKVTIAQYKIPDWRLQTSNLELRVSPNETYIADDGGAGILLEAGGVYRKVAVSVATETINGYSSPVLTIPQLTLYSTIDAVVNRGATLRAAIYNSVNGKLVKELSGFSTFALRAIANTSWTDIAFDNSVIPYINRPNFDQELKAYVDFAYLNKTIGGNVSGDITSAIATEPPTSTSLANRTYVQAQRGVVNAALIESFPEEGASIGALYKALNGNQDLYQWTGEAWNPVNGGKFLATNFGFVADGDTATPTDNHDAWEGLIAALPPEGGEIVFPPGSFYSSGSFSTTKPIKLTGAGSAYVADAFDPKGTILIFGSGQSGIRLLLGSRGSEVSFLTLKTNNGFAAVSTGDGVYSEDNCHLANLYISEFGRDGVHFVGSGGANTDNSTLRAITCWTNKRDNFHFDGGGDTNIITTIGCHSTNAGRHGFYDAGFSNIHINPHCAFSSRVTAGSKDYYVAGGSCSWVMPYSEGGASEYGNPNTPYFFLANAASYQDVTIGLFGAPEVQFDNSAFAGHRIWRAGKTNELRLTDQAFGAFGASHDYIFKSGNFNFPNEFIIYDETDSVSILSYNPTNTVMKFKNLNFVTVAPDVVSPSSITSNQNNYNPAAGTVYRLTTDAERTITGWTAPALDGTEKEIWNIGSNDLVLAHQSASSTAANRFITNLGLDLAIQPGGGAKMRYDLTTQRWRVYSLQ